MIYCTVYDLNDDQTWGGGPEICLQLTVLARKWSLLLHRISKQHCKITDGGTIISVCFTCTWVTCAYNGWVKLCCLPSFFRIPNHYITFMHDPYMYIRKKYTYSYTYTHSYTSAITIAPKSIFNCYTPRVYIILPWIHL